MSDKRESKRGLTRRQIIKSIPVGIAGAVAVSLVAGRVVSGFVRRRQMPDLPDDSIFALTGRGILRLSPFREGDPRPGKMTAPTQSHSVGPRRVGPVVLLLAAIALLLAGCGLVSGVEPTPTPVPLSVDEILRRSGEALGALGTFHFTLDHNKGGGTPISESVVVTEVEGDVVSPDSISITFAGTFGRFAVKSSIVTIGNDSYMTNPVTGVWEQVSTGVSPLGFFDPQEGIGSMMTQMRDAVLVSRTPEEYRIDGTLAVEALRPLLGTVSGSSDVDVELTIDSGTLLLEKAVIEGRVTATEPDGVVRTITLSGFDEPITISPPG